LVEFIMSFSILRHKNYRKNFNKFLLFTCCWAQWGGHVCRLGLVPCGLTNNLHQAYVPAVRFFCLGSGGSLIFTQAYIIHILSLC
jgi:hypothetical protein